MSYVWRKFPGITRVTDKRKPLLHFYNRGVLRCHARRTHKGDCQIDLVYSANVAQKAPMSRETPGLSLSNNPEGKWAIGNRSELKDKTSLDSLVHIERMRPLYCKSTCLWDSLTLGGTCVPFGGKEYACMVWFVESSRLRLQRESYSA